MKNRIVISAVILGFFFTLIVVANAKADVYVKVDASGNAIGGAIMCDAGTCGAGSEYSQLTLQAGEQYVLQATGHAGIGNNNPNTQVKVDIGTNDWTVTRQVEVKPVEPLLINDQKVISYTVETKETFNPITNPPSWQTVSQPITLTPEPTLKPIPEPTPVLPPTETTTATATTAIIGNALWLDTSTATALKIAPTTDYITITKDKNGKLVITKKKFTAKVRKAVRK
jgi:hypothetical protein